MNILITGGSSGLGKAITEKLSLEQNNQVYFTYNESVSAASELEKQFSNAHGIHCDYLNTESIETLLTKLSDLEIDVLVNNAYAGNLTQQHFHKGDIERFENDFKKNIVPVIKITSKVISGFRKKKFGKIITILSSVIVNKPPVGWADYTAGKAYLHSLSKSWAAENATFNITANCISPAFMQTALTKSMDERIVEEIENNHPLKKLLTPQDVADTVLYYVNCSQQINGTNFLINAASTII
jgi:3-oxoacyl-[acyl-carrier protein] reductase